jgi:two-component system NtrC family sensor kinase
LSESNERLRSTQLQLIQSEKLAAIGHLTAGIVHDVKNPLTVIKGMAELIQEGDGLDTQTKKDLKLIRENAEKATNIVTDLLKFSRQSTPEMKYGDLRETVETTLRLTSYLLRKNQITLVTELSKQPIMAVYDSQQIEQVLINLIHNAIQAMPASGSLKVTLEGTEKSVSISIQDTGVGIPPENINRIFDPFYTTKPAGEGTGLGLSVSYGIVSCHGGRIEVESTYGQGSTFTIILPLKPPQRPEGDMA